ncbi:DgyrCDS12974 [Dimorphilus gyrociliatus]|uniref:Spindle and centriole-associated protein 1 n=1 Tax=Dimorphilus gyrociliatus TaxID=2664684 RepID=A0A7I8W996_9ANNE|nr:DgyrCDS12974 [Dimorphilus gyrociliatus]
MFVQRKTKLKPKSKKKLKPEWDSTINDLNVYKASTDDIIRRKESHKSKNAESAKFDLLSLRLRELNEQKNSKKEQDKSKKSAIHKVYLDNSQLSETLAECDKTLAVVKDMFGDDPKKFFGIPSVTVAPKRILKNDQSLLPDGTEVVELSKLDALSDSIMSKNSLDRLNDNVSNDLEQYKHILNENRAKADMASEDWETSFSSLNRSTLINTVNDTAVVESSVKSEGREDTREEIKETAENASCTCECHKNSKEEILMLVDAVTKLAQCARESEKRAAVEALKREELESKVERLNCLVNVLAADMVANENRVKIALKTFQTKNSEHSSERGGYSEKGEENVREMKTLERREEEREEEAIHSERNRRMIESQNIQRGNPLGKSYNNKTITAIIIIMHILCIVLHLMDSYDQLKTTISSTSHLDGDKSIESVAIIPDEVDASHEYIQKQLEELNRKHLEAKLKLDGLLQGYIEVKGENGQNSPPVSPILPGSPSSLRVNGR